MHHPCGSPNTSKTAGRRSKIERNCTNLSPRGDAIIPYVVSPIRHVTGDTSHARGQTFGEARTKNGTIQSNNSKAIVTIRATTTTTKTTRRQRLQHQRQTEAATREAETTTKSSPDRILKRRKAPSYTPYTSGGQPSSTKTRNEGRKTQKDHQSRLSKRVSHLATHTSHRSTSSQKKREVR